MERSEDWEKLLNCLTDTFSREKAKCKVMGQTKLGLVEITRKKEGQTLAARYLTACPECSGRGWLVKTEDKHNN